MHSDSSKVMLERYLGLKNRLVRFTMFDATVIEGWILGFYFGNTRLHEPFVTGWHIAEPAEKGSLGVDEFGCRVGHIVAHEAIAKVLFFEDGSVLQHEPLS